MIGYIDGPTPPMLVTDATSHMATMPAFQVDYVTSTKELVMRQLRVFVRNRAFVRSRLIMVLMMGFLYSTTFYDVDPEDAVVVLGVVFVAVLFLALGQVPLIPAAVQAREIFYKQRSAQFYRTSSFIVAQSFTQVPFALAETIVFGSILYWGSGFVAEAGAFLIYLLLLFLTTLVYASWFFFLAMVAPNLHVSKPMAMVSVLIYVLFAGFVIFPHDIPDYFIWIYWINPLSWCMRALAINQYSADEFQHCHYKNGPRNYCTSKGDVMGNIMLETFGLKTKKIWILWGIAFQICCYFLFMGLAYLALEYKRYDVTDHSFVPVTDAEDDGAKDNDIYVPAPVTPTESRAVTIRSAGTAAVPVTLAFQDLWYSVPNPTKGEPDLKLLKGINGYALPGTITALMGSSGAGKTTLMDVIAGRKTGGKIEGQILLNGYPATDLAIRRATGYCEQMDIHCCSATFREAFQFSAMLRQSSDIATVDKLAFADECLELLNLTPIADSIIRGSSVEQMKRLTIGVELAAAPSVLFLDEPTSGLDARSAKIIMTGIRKIASTGRTVVCTIHQPSKEVFEMFDSLLLLKRGGETVFFGDLGHKASRLIEYFSSIPNTPPLLDGYNPATWMLEVIGAGVDAKHSDFPPNDYVHLFSQSSEHTVLETALAAHTQPHPSIPELTFRHKRAASSSTQCAYLVQRFFRMYWRTPSYNWTRALLSVFLAVLFGLMYRGIDYATYTGATGGVGMVFMTSLFVVILPRACVANVQRAVYFVGTTLAEIPYVFGTSFIFTIIFYPFVGLGGSVGDCLFYGYNLSMLVLMNVYLGQLMVYASPRVEVAALLGMLINAIFFLFMGYTPPASKIPNGYRWVYHITPLKYSVAIMTAETFATCDEPGDLGCQVMKGVPQSLLDKVGAKHIRLKDFVEHVYEMKEDDRAMNIWVVIGCIALFRLLALICLRYVNHQKR
ncbi:ATP-binding Cassette (ABC) Superfamily [Achlya hypogyna]|uniref:ATP-binding Cassette (ABC) Superfamily n=1 Tax=Achlya hypogyna TaxID=1202772 RepID=A0A1V9YTM3_ACHHY|nr:ATP-binding Cassette (ABC) Superfamily [Achlya hypogyna]